ncbi:MAG TPA: hypothetical protein VFK34_00760 [Marmoricola sp.]|nr:hypothetical protein [Marmoricola sp.]
MADPRRAGGWMVPAGIVVFVLGVVFFLQGVGELGGSVMSDSTTWAVLGPVIAIFGIGLVARGLRRR